MTFEAAARFLGVRGLIALGLALALGFVMWRADTFSARLDKSRDALAAEKTAHEVTKASLAQLEQTSAAYVAEGRRRTVAVQRALERQESHSAALSEQIARIRSAKPATAEIERCETPAAVRGARGL